MIAFNESCPLISIITPVYNGAEYLEELILSILEQDYPYFEHIIIDDGSNDNGATLAIIKKYPHLRWWSRENKGQYATLNEGFSAAKGEIVNIICADDKYANSSVLSTVVAFWQNHSDCGCVYGDTLHMNEKSALISVFPGLIKPPYPSWFIRYQLLIQHCSLFVDKSLISNNGIAFDLLFKYAADWDWIIRLSQATKFTYLNKPLSIYRVHAAQTTLRVEKKKLLLENRKVLERYKSNYIFYQLQVYQLRLLKTSWLIRNNGFVGFYKAFNIWLSRR